MMSFYNAIVAASGGYYMACAADKIVAHPTTITGSIGVIAASLFVGDALSDFGVTNDGVTKNRNADLVNGLVKPNDEQVLKHYRVCVNYILYLSSLFKA